MRQTEFVPNNEFLDFWKKVGKLSGDLGQEPSGLRPVMHEIPEGTNPVESKVYVQNGAVQVEITRTLKGGPHPNVEVEPIVTVSFTRDAAPDFARKIPFAARAI